MTRKLNFAFMVGSLLLLVPAAVYGQAANPNAEPKRIANDPPTASDQSQASRDTNTVPANAALGVLLRKAEEGVTVVGVIPGSGAARAGIRWGDEIRNLGDQRVRRVRDITEVMRNSKPGEQINVSIVRKGQSQVLKATLGTPEATFGRDDQTTAIQTSPNAPGVLAPTTTANNNRAQSPASRDQIYALNQQIALLNQQIDLLHRQMNQASVSTPAVATPAAPGTAANTANEPGPNTVDDWWSRNQRGETDGDGSLFQ